MASDTLCCFILMQENAPRLCRPAVEGFTVLTDPTAPALLILPLLIFLTEPFRRSLFSTLYCLFSRQDQFQLHSFVQLSSDQPVKLLFQQSVNGRVISFRQNIESRLLFSKSTCFQYQRHHPGNSFGRQVQDGDLRHRNHTDRCIITFQRRKDHLFYPLNLHLHQSSKCCYLYIRKRIFADQTLDTGDRIFNMQCTGSFNSRNSNLRTGVSEELREHVPQTGSRKFRIVGYRPSRIPVTRSSTDGSGQTESVCRASIRRATGSSFCRAKDARRSALAALPSSRLALIALLRRGSLVNLF